MTPVNEDAYPLADRGPARAGAGMAAAAMIWMALVAAWGIAGPFPDGHFAASAGIGTAAWNMLEFHLRYPILWTSAHPSPADAYLHHPLGVFWVTAAFIKVFGVHNWALRLPAVICSTLSPFFIYRIGRAVWGPLEGGLAAIAYVSLPITLGFSNFYALEGPVILGCLVATWGYVRTLQTARERYALASLCGFFWAINHDWSAYVWGAVFGCLLFLRAFVLPPAQAGGLQYRSIGRYLTLLILVAVVSLGAMVYFAIDAGKLQDLFGAYANRSSGNQLPLRVVLQGRHVWIELMFPGSAIFVGKVALVVILVRVALRRSWNELMVPVPLLAMATVQYLHFKEGADVHIFWPQYFAPYLALSVGALAATVREAFGYGLPKFVRWAEARGREDRMNRLGRRMVSVAPWAGVILLGLPIALIWRDGASMVRLARETGGRFNSAGIQSDVDKAVALRWYLQRYPRTVPLGIHPGMPAHWALQWEADNRVIVRGGPLGTRASHAARLYLLDPASTAVADLRQALTIFKVTVVGPYWLVDRESPPGLEGFSFQEREPTLWEWYFQGGTEPTRTVVPDPWVAWEWRTLLGGGTSGPPPTVPPASPNQVRIACNVATAANDVQTAARCLRDLQGGLNMPVTARWSDGTTLLGGYHRRGAQRSLTLLFRAGTLKGRAKFSVTGRVLNRACLSTLALDEAPIEIAPSPSPPTELWRPGSLYAVKIPYFKRPGTERYTGRFVTLDGGPVPTRVDAPGDVALLTVR